MKFWRRHSAANRDVKNESRKIQDGGVMMEEWRGRVLCIVLFEGSIACDHSVKVIDWRVFRMSSPTIYDVLR